MTGNEIRAQFLEFFKSKGHTIVASDSLVPKNDPTVLFTTAGMQQFKRQFLGHMDDYTRAATSQKCLRTDDLEEVGKTDFHHTFFEMLGNFSFGDYFKKEAIAWAWEFLTRELKIPQKKLWVSVYIEDSEAEQIWLKEIGISKDKLVKLGDKSNFWPANAKQNGPNGPCGPCSEIFYDFGVNKKCTNKNCNPDCNCGRFSEIWNLVFTQFNRTEGGVLEPLPNKNIDTGMGLERLVAVMQGKRNNFETDLFEPILKAIDQTIKYKDGVLSLTDKRIIADHVRAITLGIADGVIPSNEGRGYVIKKLIIAIADIAIRSGNTTKPIIYKLVPSVVKTMDKQYTDLKNRSKQISEIIQNIEKSYIQLRAVKIPELLEKYGILKEQVYDSTRFAEESGKLAFYFKDTHGLPIETIIESLENSAYGLPKVEKKELLEKFNELLEKQQKQSRSSSKMTGDVFTDADLNLDVPKTKFTGYEQTDGAGTILKIFIDNKEVKEVSEGDQVKIILDTTPFYAESGGQIGDTGTIETKNATIRVEDTQKIDDIYVHRGRVEKGMIKVKDTVKTAIDRKRRLSIMRHHTATHLLQAALREILGHHVQQQGSLVAEDRLRFDFTHPRAVSKKELEQIETRMNECIKRNDTVVKEEMSLEAAKKKGALAFFAEKYKNRVRVISIGDYSKEFCGGTHLDATGEIKQIVISSESAVAQGIRRLEAKAGDYAVDFIKMREAKNFERQQAEERRQQELKKKKEDEKRRLESFQRELKTMIDQAESVNNTKIVIKTFTEADANQLKVFFDLIKRQTPSVAACLGSATNASAAIIVGVSDDLVQKGIKANELIKEIALLMNGSGGGRPQLAQAGSKDAHLMEKALKKANQIIKDKIKT